MTTDPGADKAVQARRLAAEFRGTVARKDYEAWGEEVLPLLDSIADSALTHRQQEVVGQAVSHWCTFCQGNNVEWCPMDNALAATPVIAAVPKVRPQSESQLCGQLLCRQVGSCCFASCQALAAQPPERAAQQPTESRDIDDEDASWLLPPDMEDQ